VKYMETSTRKVVTFWAGDLRMSLPRRCARVHFHESCEPRKCISVSLIFGFRDTSSFFYSLNRSYRVSSKALVQIHSFQSLTKTHQKSSSQSNSSSSKCSSLPSSLSSLFPWPSAPSLRLLPFHPQLRNAYVISYLQFGLLELALLTQVQWGKTTGNKRDASADATLKERVRHLLPSILVS
jgi:hypothetical protein